MADLGFDLRQIDETQNTNFEPIPNGVYTVQVTGSEGKPNKKENGSYIKMEYTIIEQKFNGRKLWHNFNLFNPSEKAQNIGRAEIKRCILACGLSDSVSDTSALHGKMLKVKVAIVDQGENYGLVNVIKDFYPLDNQIKKEAHQRNYAQNPEQISPVSQTSTQPQQYQQTPYPVQQQQYNNPTVDYSNAPRPSWMAPVTQ